MDYRRNMQQIEIEIVSAAKRKLALHSFPELTSERKLVGKGLRILKENLPGLMRYISKQKVMGHMPSYRIIIKTREKIDIGQVRDLLEHWLRHKKNRRMAYVVVELLLMPFSAFIAVLPGPNIAFYLLFVLFYFHLKAFLSLRKIDIGKLDITLVMS
ncbi:MAG: hypothetical protein NTW95_01790 [Candidatus Aminicenantes bacterium]|nr:hypothetical protein [Candidatus Aminicenantes bacterium]